MDTSPENEYDRQAEATGWFGGEVTFGLMYAHLHSGETVLDLGIGSGLSSALFARAGLRVLGMDVDDEMLSLARSKGFAAGLTQHDLTSAPYPYDDESVDHIVCLGVLPFFADLGVLFREAGRILRRDGLFAFLVAMREDGEPSERVVGPEHTGTGSSVVMYRHSAGQILALLDANGFSPLRDLELAVPMDPARTAKMQTRMVVARREPQV